MIINLNTKNSFSERIISQLFSNIVNLNIRVNQVDCVYDKLIDNIGTVDDKFAELMNKIQSLSHTYVNNPKTNIELFGKICLLYFKGGIILNKNILIKDMTSLLKLYETNDVCVIKSCVNEKIFDGILMIKQENQKILEILNTFLNDPYNIDVSALLLNVASTVLNESITLNKSNIYDDRSNIFAEHYFGEETLLERFKLMTKVQNDLAHLKIGITINVPSSLNDFYSNGIRQNCLYLYELLKNVGYDIKLIIDNDKNISVLKEIDFYVFEYVIINDIFMYDFDLIFSMGFSMPENIFNSLKNTGVKIISYMCGNNYLIDSERILYDQHKNRNINYSNEVKYDQIWIIPQMYNQNKYYCEILQKTKSIQIPFVWSPMSIKIVKKILKLEDDSSLLYKKKENKIGIFEPNLSVMKWALPCVLIAENTHRTYKNIEHVYVTNLNKKNESDINKFNMNQFNKICLGLELFKEKKITAESRYITLEMMSKSCDIAISHQWENPLNYLYLDLAWMGWPILHNAHLCKDVGYYYEGFNYYEASEMLNNILTNHEANSNNYLTKNREIIDMYIPTNKSLQDKYKNLIENLFK